MDTTFSSFTTSSYSHEDLSTKFEIIRKNFVGNTYDLDQIDVDGIYELEIIRRKIREHTNIKLKRQLKLSLKPVPIVILGEPRFDRGGQEGFSHCILILLQEILCQVSAIPLLCYMASKN